MVVYIHYFNLVSVAMSISDVLWAIASVLGCRQFTSFIYGHSSGAACSSASKQVHHPTYFVENLTSSCFPMYVMTLFPSANILPSRVTSSQFSCAGEGTLLVLVAFVVRMVPMYYLYSIVYSWNCWCHVACEALCVVILRFPAPRRWCWHQQNYLL